MIYTFMVAVEVVTHDEDKWGDRTPEQYAETALYVASLRDARQLDGFADLKAEAYIGEVEKA